MLFSIKAPELHCLPLIVSLQFMYESLNFVSAEKRTVRQSACKTQPKLSSVNMDKQTWKKQRLSPYQTKAQERGWVNEIQV